MVFILALILAGIIVAAGGGAIKKHPGGAYAASLILAAAVVAVELTGAVNYMPGFAREVLWPVLSKSTLGTALFIIVMFAGAIPDSWKKLKKRLIPIRGNLSIMAAILVLSHNISYGAVYFRMLITSPGSMPGYILAASICSIIMIAIMIPLTVTSFMAVRKKMKASSWKKLQRSAYFFYGLIYIHVMLLYVPSARSGNTSYMVTVVAYTAVFMIYAGMRVLKAFGTNQAVRKLSVAVPVIFALLVCAEVTVPSLSRADAGTDPDMNMQIVGDEDKTPLSSGEILDGENADGINSDSETDGESTSDENAEKDASDNSASDSEGNSASDKTSKPTGSTNTDNGTNSSGTSGSASQSSGSASSGVQNATPSATAPQSEETPAVTYKYKNGTFTGSAQGYNGQVTVSVTIKDDVIKSVSVVSHSDDEPFISNAKAVTGKIVSAQSTNVSAVSGATYSSNGIINAAAAALNSALN